MSSGKKDRIFGWLVGASSGIWLVYGWFGWFVGGFTGLWMVSSFTAHVQLLHRKLRQNSKCWNKKFKFAGWKLG